jgi:hypothetical protein
MVGIVKGDLEWVIKHSRGFGEGDAVLLQVIILLSDHPTQIPCRQYTTSATILVSSGAGCDGLQSNGPHKRRELGSVRLDAAVRRAHSAPTYGRTL